MSVYSYLWDSSAHLSNAAFVLEFAAALIELVVGIVIVSTFHKEWNEHVKKRIEFLFEVGFLVAAVIAVVAIASNRRLETLRESEDRDAKQKSDTRIAELTNTLAEAGKNVAEATERAANAEMQAAAAKEKTKWRTITPEKVTAFINSTKPLSKLPIRVRMAATADTETESFAQMIRRMLDKAGYAETNEDLAINRWPEGIDLLWTGAGPELPPVMLFYNATAMSPIISLEDAQKRLKSYANYTSNSVVRTEFQFLDEDIQKEAFVTDDNGTPVLHIPVPAHNALKIMAFTSVQSALSGIGIQAGLGGVFTNMPPDTFEIFVNVR